MSLTLTTIGSRGVTLRIEPAALPEAKGGITLWIGYHPGAPLEERETTYTLTAEEAGQLVVEIQRVLSAPQASYAPHFQREAALVLFVTCSEPS